MKHRNICELLAFLVDLSLNCELKTEWFSVIYPKGQLRTSRSPMFDYARKWRQVKTFIFRMIRLNERNHYIDVQMAFVLRCAPTSEVLDFSLQRRGKDPTEHHPEVILNNFTTRLGHSIGRMFAALFPQNPQFLGRQVATFHNQRDFVFFRFHRWIWPLHLTTMWRLNHFCPCLLVLYYL